MGGVQGKWKRCDVRVGKQAMRREKEHLKMHWQLIEGAGAKNICKERCYVGASPSCPSSCVTQGLPTIPDAQEHGSEHRHLKMREETKLLNLFRPSEAPSVDHLLVFHCRSKRCTNTAPPLRGLLLELDSRVDPDFPVTLTVQQCIFPTQATTAAVFPTSLALNDEKLEAFP